MSHSTPSYIAGADIGPSLFVKITGDHTVEPCVANDVADGVSHQGTREAPIPGVTPLAVAEGESCQIFGADEPCEIVAGGAITAGAKLIPDINGKAVAAVAGVSPIPYSAVARSSAAAGEKVKATLTRGTLPAA